MSAKAWLTSRIVPFMSASPMPMAASAKTARNRASLARNASSASFCADEYGLADRLLLGEGPVAQRIRVSRRHRALDRGQAGETCVRMVAVRRAGTGDREHVGADHADAAAERLGADEMRVDERHAHVIRRFGYEGFGVERVHQPAGLPVEEPLDLDRAHRDVPRRGERGPPGLYQMGDIRGP